MSDVTETMPMFYTICFTFHVKPDLCRRSILHAAHTFLHLDKHEDLLWDCSSSSRTARCSHFKFQTVTRSGITAPHAATSCETRTSLRGVPEADDIFWRCRGLRACKYHILGDMNVRVVQSRFEFFMQDPAAEPEALWEIPQKAFFYHLKTSSLKCCTSFFGGQKIDISGASFTLNTAGKQTRWVAFEVLFSFFSVGKGLLWSEVT